MFGMVWLNIEATCKEHFGKPDLGPSNWWAATFQRSWNWGSKEACMTADWQRHDICIQQSCTKEKDSNRSPQWKLQRLKLNLGFVLKSSCFVHGQPNGGCFRIRRAWIYLKILQILHGIPAGILCYENGNVSHVRTARNSALNPPTQHWGWHVLKEEPFQGVWRDTDGLWKTKHLTWTLRDGQSWNCRMWGRRKGIFLRRNSVSNVIKRDKYDRYMRNREKVSLGNLRVHDGL